MEVCNFTESEMVIFAGYFFLSILILYLTCMGAMYIFSQLIFKMISIPDVKRIFFCIMESFCCHAGFYSVDRILLKTGRH